MIYAKYVFLQLTLEYPSKKFHWISSSENHDSSTVCLFSNATLHDGRTQPPGEQMTSTMAHFVDTKGAFYDQ